VQIVDKILSLANLVSITEYVYFLDKIWFEATIYFL